MIVIILSRLVNVCICYVSYNFKFYPLIEVLIINWNKFTSDEVCVTIRKLIKLNKNKTWMFLIQDFSQVYVSSLMHLFLQKPYIKPK